MAKANSGKVIQMLSPENYIRKKARTLPVYECLVNTDWEKSKLANMVIARQHTNGSITACIYLVDLMCLGVKDTDYMFNIPMFEYKENIDQTFDRSDLVPITYELAHNIVHAGLEFADEYGFSPHKDFTSITCYIQDDEIPDELPGIVPGTIANPNRIKELFIDIYYSLDEDPENAREKLKTLRSQAKTIPGVAFLELIILQFEESAEYNKKLNEYFSQHNDYPLIRLLWLIEQVTSENFTDENLLQVINRESFFPGRHSLHRIELYYFLMYSIDIIAIKDDPSGLEAFSQVLDDFDGLSDDDRVALIQIISFLKVKIVINHFENNI